MNMLNIFGNHKCNKLQKFLLWCIISHFIASDKVMLDGLLPSKENEKSWKRIYIIKFMKNWFLRSSALYSNLIIWAIWSTTTSITSLLLRRRDSKPGSCKWNIPWPGLVLDRVCLFVDLGESGSDFFAIKFSATRDLFFPALPNNVLSENSSSFGLKLFATQGGRSGSKNYKNMRKYSWTKQTAPIHDKYMQVKLKIANQNIPISNETH